jgi:hypothetical protein
MAKTGMVIPLWQIAPPAADGSLPRYPSINAIPTFEEFYESVKGKKPSGTAYEALRAMMDAQTGLFRAMFLPPTAPKEATDTIRAAMIALEKDKGFIETYQKVVRSPPIFVTGQDGEKIMGRLATVKPEVREFLNDTVKRVSGGN